MEKIFHNYDVSFHNEIWASAFSGKFASGTTWQWERVFWWPDAVPRPPHDFQDQQYWINNPTGFSNVLDFDNVLNVGGTPITVRNRRLHHHFRPLADLLQHPSWLAYEFFNGDYTAEKFFDYDPNAPNVLEAYYLRNLHQDPNSSGSTVAIGWVHNRNAWVMNNFYLWSSTQNFLGCVPTDPSTSSTITLTGFAPQTEFHVTWFPTRIDATIAPQDTEEPIESNANGELVIDLTDQFGGVYDNYLDTLRQDYAFIITPEPFVKSLFFESNEEVLPDIVGWDFTLYPNPARETLFLRFQDDAPKEITVLDVTGRRMIERTNVTGTTFFLPTGELAKGAYWVRVTYGVNMRAKKLIIH